MRPSSLVLLSGGLDSVASFYWAKHETDLVLALTFDYGQRAAAREIEAAKKICDKNDIKHQVIELPWYRTLKNSALIDTSATLPDIKIDQLDNMEIVTQSAQAVWVPNRNGVLVSVAGSIAEAMLANWIVVGFNKEEAKTFPDNSPEFVDAQNKALKYSTNNQITLKAPMGSKTKKEIVAYLKEQNFDFSLLWSCYRGGEKMCGVCESCSRLQRALAS